MKNTFIKTTLLTLAFSMPAFGGDGHDSGSHGKTKMGAMHGKMITGHQGKMNQHMQKMHDMMKGMEKGGSGKSSMKDHMKAMSKGVGMLNDMQMDVIRKNKECLAKEANLPTDQTTCYEEESHNDTQIRMMTEMMNQMLKHMEMMEK